MVEIIPKPKEKKFSWQNIFFYLSLVLLLITVLTYFILNNSLKKAETNLKNLEETLAKGKTAEEIDLEKSVLVYQRKIEDFSRLINQHILSSKFFEFIEKNSHPQVWFSKLDLNPISGEVKISGKAESFAVLDQQLQIFSKNPSVKNLNLVNLGIGKEGGADFSLNLTLDPNLFK